MAFEEIVEVLIEKCKAVVEESGEDKGYTIFELAEGVSALRGLMGAEKRLGAARKAQVDYLEKIEKEMADCLGAGGKGVLGVAKIMKRVVAKAPFIPFPREPERQGYWDGSEWEADLRDVGGAG